MKISFRPIGVVKTPFQEPQGTPIQPQAGAGVEGSVEIYPEFKAGLKDIEGFSHIVLIYHFHLMKTYKLHAKPFMDNEERGIFAIRGPARPNPIGLSIVELVRVEDNVLHIRDLDIIDGTPLLDIKPYVPRFDEANAVRTGWLKTNIHKLEEMRDDGRFAKQPQASRKDGSDK